MFEKLEGGVVGKTPGQINGEDFAIDNCKVWVAQTLIYLQDHLMLTQLSLFLSVEYNYLYI